jgi:hypothetical protein
LNLFSGIVDVTYLHAVTTKFHNHTTPLCIHITANKLRLNKLPHASTYAFGIRLLSPQQGGYHPIWLPRLMVELRTGKVEAQVALASAPELLQMSLSA